MHSPQSKQKMCIVTPFPSHTQQLLPLSYYNDQASAAARYSGSIQSATSIQINRFIFQAFHFQCAPIR